MPLTDSEVQVILDELQRGQTVSVGGSRAHTTLGFRNGAWFEAAFDEGAVEEHPITAAQLRRTIESHPDAFRPLLRAPHLRRFRSAFLGGDHLAARSALHAASAWGDPFSYYALWQAALEAEAPSTKPADLPADASPPGGELVATIRSHLRGHTAWHAFWEPMAWDRTPGNARRGLWFLERLVDLVAAAPTSTPDPVLDPALAAAVESQRSAMAALANAPDTSG